MNPCFVCKSPCSTSIVVEPLFELESKQNDSVKLRCDCIYHRFCLQSIIQSQLQGSQAPTCLQCRRSIKLKQPSVQPPSEETQYFFDLHFLLPFFFEWALKP